MDFSIKNLISKMLDPSIPPSGKGWQFTDVPPWPSIRGRHLMEYLLHVSNDEPLNTSDNEPVEEKIIPFEVELCVPTPGHIAFSLVLKTNSTIGINDSSKLPISRHISKPQQSNTSAQTRVIYVVDAIPPKGIDSLHSPQQNKRSSSGSRENGNRKMSFAPLPQQEVNEIQLIQELFEATKIEKDGSIIVKPPFLCARHDCRIAGIEFTRSKITSKSHTVSSTLRCIIAREDGMVYLWEWHNELYQWQFANRLCFLENPNLSWTKPVAMFTLVSMPLHGEVTEFSWWSMENKQEPKLCFRKIRFEQETNSFQTEIIVGNSFSFKCGDVYKLLPSKKGLWICTSQGIYLRSATSMRMLHHEKWNPQTFLSKSQYIIVHNITGELVFLSVEKGEVSLLKEVEGALVEHKVVDVVGTKLKENIRDVVVHRHLMIILTDISNVKEIQVYSLLSGDFLSSLKLPYQSHPVHLWTIHGVASSTGIWSPKGVLWLQTPDYKTLARIHLERQEQDPTAAFQSVKDYGLGARLDVALLALESLEKSPVTLNLYRQPEWRVAFETIASPCLLLSILSENKAPEQLLRDITDMIMTIHRVSQEIQVQGKLDLVNKQVDTSLQHVTPVNIEALPYLSNWILLAKRKLARIQAASAIVKENSKTQSDHKGLRARTISALTSGGAYTNNTWISSSSPLALDENEDENEPQDLHASSTHLSRKLRPMRSLRFAAGCCSYKHGKKWLQVLEKFLLDGVSFKQKQLKEGHYQHVMPSHLLFHDERQLQDFTISTSSFSKHMYFEHLSRLYLLHEPGSLVPFVDCVTHFCPRLISLSGITTIKRTHAERALSMLPAAHFFVNQWRLSNKSKLEEQSLLGYVELLIKCDFYLEACEHLLSCSFYERCKKMMREELNEKKHPTMKDTLHQVFFKLLEYCVVNLDAEELLKVIQLKPDTMQSAHVLRMLRMVLVKKKSPNNSKTVGQLRVNVGAMRQALSWLLTKREK
jgi:hypothetical protein